MANSNVWEARIRSIVAKIIELVWVVVIYLASELTIWGLSRLLAPAKIEFFASIFSMLIVFVTMSSLYLWYRLCDEFYQIWIKSKVDFINSHLGVGFPIPIVMLDQREVLDGQDIARIIGNFAVTNLVSWAASFVVSFFVMITSSRFWGSPDKQADVSSLTRPLAPTPPGAHPNVRWDSASTAAGSSEEAHKKSSGADDTPTLSQRTSIDCIPPTRTDHSTQWNRISKQYPIFISLLCLFSIGAPTTATTEDSRILDGCTLWFVWISAVRLQRLFKESHSCPNCPRLKNVFVTLINPVLTTTLLMTGYTRAKATAMQGVDLTQVLEEFSSGTPLYTLWTSGATGTPLPSNPNGFFGAGDAAMSILECGILIWGFKLYECRRQLFSVAGMLTAVLSAVFACGNVFLCVVSGHMMGLNTPEALAFAARSTTLALAKPAIEAVGGNLVLNAALVVSNGILGQLMCPFALGKLGIRNDSSASIESTQGSKDHDAPQMRVDHCMGRDEGNSASKDDDPVTIAAGISIGINGAAMGVAYLYETKSRAAPYAALSMTVSGIVTVIFTTVEPFKSAVIRLASI